MLLDQIDALLFRMGLRKLPFSDAGPRPQQQAEGKGIEVLEYGPQAWYLLSDGDRLYLDVNCNHSFVGYSFTMQLNLEEVAEYRRRRRAYIDELAHAIQRSAPGISGTGSIYKERLVAAEVSAEVNDAIRVWLAASASGCARKR